MFVRPSEFYRRWIGINHNGDIGVAKRLIDAERMPGVTRSSFRSVAGESYSSRITGTSSVRRHGLITYLDHRYKVEPGDKAYSDIHRYARTPAFSGSLRAGMRNRSTSSSSSRRFATRRLRFTERPCLVTQDEADWPSSDHLDRYVNDGWNRRSRGCVGHRQPGDCDSTSAYPCAPEEPNL